MGKERILKDKFLPFQMRNFTYKHFDSWTLHIMQDLIPDFKFENLVFTLAAFISPKQAITSLINDPKAIKALLPKQQDILARVADLPENNHKWSKLTADQKYDCVLEQLTDTFYGHLEG